MEGKGEREGVPSSDQGVALSGWGEASPLLTLAPSLKRQPPSERGTDFCRLLLPSFRKDLKYLAYSKSIAMLGTAQKFHAHWFLYCSDNIQQDLATNINCNNLNS